jgi:CBS domain-containing protein
VLGRVRESGLGGDDDTMTVERALEPGPGTVRPSETAAELVRRLAERDRRTAIVTTPEGILLGVFHRADAERRLAENAG